jgi:hypothetical protein
MEEALARKLGEVMGKLAVAATEAEGKPARILWEVFPELAEEMEKLIEQREEFLKAFAAGAMSVNPRKLINVVRDFVPALPGHPKFEPVPPHLVKGGELRLKTEEGVIILFKPTNKEGEILAEAFIQIFKARAEEKRKEEEKRKKRERH